MKFNTRYAPPKSPSIDFSDSPSMTQQHFKDECDINNIVSTYQQTGVLPQRTDALYGDFTGIPDNPLDAKKVFDEAQEKFLQLPSDFRKMLDNSPAKFLDFIGNEANRDVCVKYGIFNAHETIPAAASKSVANAENVSTESTSVSENKN